MKSTKGKQSKGWRRGRILSHALERMTAPSAEGAKGDFASAEAGFRACGHDRRTEPVWRLCARPLETFARSLFTLYGNPTLAGRGGSVSRRDHNQAAGNRAPTRMGAQVRRKSQAYSQPLFGREGSGGRGASLREAASLATLTSGSFLLRIAAGRLVL